MAAAFHRAGFDAIDVHMSDLLGGRIGLGNFHALVACGGFSYGDVLGRAKVGRNPFCLTLGCATNSKPFSIVRRRWRLGVQRLPDDVESARADPGQRTVAAFCT